MKKIFTLLTLIGILFSTKAQLANQGFETWESPMLSNNINATGSFSGITFYVCGSFTYNELEDWSSTNQITKGSNTGNVELVTQSSTAIEGASSVQIESKTISINAFLDAGCTIPPPSPLPSSIDNVAPGLIVNGTLDIEIQELVDNILGGTGLNALNPFTYPGAGQAIDFIPKTLSGYYQYTGQVDASTGILDSCIIVSGLKKDGELIGHVIQRLGNASSWTPFSLDYTHLNCETPDSIVTVISSSSIDMEIINSEFVINSDFTGVDGSVMLVDAIHLDTMNLADFPPLLANDFDTILIGSISTLSVLNNDVFCDMGTYAPVVDMLPSNGTVSVNVSNEIEYTPSASYTGTDMYTYYICNTATLCDTVTVMVTVEPVAICYANDDVRTLDLAIDATDNFFPISNDVDCGNTISILGSGPSNGTAVVESNNSITYSPNANFSGADEFEYYLFSANNPSQSDTATIKYTVISGINEIDANLIEMYPNPASDKLFLNIDLDSEISIVIYNTIGEKILTSSFNKSKTINIESFNNGLYFIEISANNKKSVRKIQVIK